MSTEERTFNPTLSTNEVFREDDMTRCFSDDLNTIESDISALETGKAAVNHTHSDYAAKNHTHTGYAASNHNHNSAYIRRSPPCRLRILNSRKVGGCLRVASIAFSICPIIFSRHLQPPL